MRLPLYWGWGLAALPLLSLLFGFTARRAMEALGYPRTGPAAGLWIALDSLLLAGLWCAANIPLPLFYLLAFAAKLPYLLQRREDRPKEWFLVNIAHLCSIALHMVLIGASALALGKPMRLILQAPFWRAATFCAVLLANILVDWLVPRWGVPLAVVRNEAGSGEVRPFLAFLWSCNLFLLLDSLLCVSPIDWGLAPLFLIASTLLLELYIFRFLSHIYSILRVQYLEKEHLRLMAELEQRNRSAAELRNKSHVDPLTGIFSRRYLLEQADFLLQKRAPFCLAFIDLDHLKRINDQEGHHAGDLYLIHFTKAFGAFLRRTDIFARIGGDEFVVLLPGCMESTAQARLESIRSSLAKEASHPLSFSFGVAYVSPVSNEGVEQVLRRADQAMYRDKARNET